jgi:hypothetical protein
MEIYNGTQHEITIFSVEDTYSIQNGRKLILKQGANPVCIIDAGINLSCVKTNLPSPDFKTSYGKITLKGAVVFESYDPLPLEAIGKLVIVSNLYRSAVKELGGDTSFLCTVDGAVYDSENAMRPCGCLALAVG